jgi:peroxiredoxin
VKPAALVAQVAFIAVAATAVYGFVHAAQTDHRRAACVPVCAMRPAYSGNDRLAPDFELSSIDGTMVKLSSFRGKTVVLNFWTKTCEPCLEEMPALAELAKIVRARGDIVVLTVSTDDGPDAVRDTLKVALDGEVPFPVLFDPESDVVLGKYGTKLFPETWIIDPDGVIRARFDGARDWSDSVALQIAESVGGSGSCPVQFSRGKPEGPFAGLCSEEP